ncbi:hypothetical protein Ancab_030047 [Ancistrocladus abbreviatus]
MKIRVVVENSRTVDELVSEMHLVFLRPQTCFCVGEVLLDSGVCSSRQMIYESKYARAYRAASAELGSPQSTEEGQYSHSIPKGSSDGFDVGTILEIASIIIHSQSPCSSVASVQQSAMLTKADFADSNTTFSAIVVFIRKRFILIGITRMPPNLSLVSSQDTDGMAPILGMDESCRKFSSELHSVVPIEQALIDLKSSLMDQYP